MYTCRVFSFVLVAAVVCFCVECVCVFFMVGRRLIWRIGSSPVLVCSLFVLRGLFCMGSE